MQTLVFVFKNYLYRICEMSVKIFCKILKIILENYLNHFEKELPFK